MKKKIRIGWAPWCVKSDYKDYKEDIGPRPGAFRITRQDARDEVYNIFSNSKFKILPVFVERPK